MNPDLSSNEAHLRHALVECGRICYDRKLITSTDGNLSVRLGDSRLIITPAGICKGRMRAQDLIVIDVQDSEGYGRTPSRISTETPMHREVYTQRPDINAVIHAHPVFATALSVAGLDFPIDILPEGVILLGDVPTTVFAAPSSQKDAPAIRDMILKHDALILRQHGALACGRDLETALSLLERIEFVAEVFHRAHALGKVLRLSPEERIRLQQMPKNSTPR